MNKKQIDRRTLLLGAATLTAGGFVRNSARAEEFAKLQALKLGSAAHDARDLLLAGPDGALRKLSSLRGKPFLFHVWATWCAPCKRELPRLDAFRASHPEITLVTAAVASGAPEKVVAFLKAAGLSHIDPLTVDRKAFEAWLEAREFDIPVTYLVDAQSKIRASYVSGLDWSAPDAAGVIAADFASAKI